MDVSMVLNVKEEVADIEPVDQDVTSTTSIQFRESDPPMPYQQLKEYTNLNLLPENWLKSNISGKFYDGAIRKSKSFDLSSFRMASRYLDHVGNVDVISDAENIKRLLKTPYSDARLSMAVHRIGNTLLVNELDIPNILSAASQNPELSRRLEWLRNLYCDIVDVSQDSNFQRRRNSREEDLTDRILSKFLQHSMVSSPSVEEISDVKHQSISLEQSNEGSLDFIDEIHDFVEVAPECSKISCSEYSKAELEPPFRREVLWNLDDISMLVGSNMHIFGGGKYPVVSLQLRDATKPINVLTGLDYWLDNLMCNVPELVMCYHIEGIVQRYEVVMTEELPKLDGCRFSPGVVKDIAQDILSFLKSQCTKEGHTYWLFKDSECDIVKLYDLTSICNESTMENCVNPFTFPVASLLYRIARNMISNGIRNKKEAVAACSLLQNCIILLDQESHLELLLAANYLLAQLYMKDSFPDENTEQADPSFDDDFSDNTYIQADGSYYSDIKKGKVWLDSTREEKCRATISFVVKAFDLCNQICDKTPPRSLSFDVGESYDSGSSSDKGEDDRKHGRIVVAKHDKELALESRFSNDYGLRYDGDFKISLKSNAIAAYTSLAAININKNKYGRALKYLKIALSCLETIPTAERPILLLRKHAEIGMRIGDICLKFVHMRTFSYEDCLTLSEEDAQFFSYVSSNTFGEEASNAQCYIAEIDDILKFSSEDLLLKALSWYENSLDVSPADNTDQENVQQILALTARLGNVRNELGLFYMDMASALLKDWGEPSSEEQEIWKKSYQYFEKGIEAFSVIDDRRNKALLYSNKARIMRMCAQAYGNSTRPSGEANRGQFIQPERIYFSKAFEFYQKSLSSLGSRSEMPDIWDQISYDLSGTFFKMACIMQDNAPLSSISFEEVSKEVQTLMMKSLHFCHDEEEQTESPRYRDIRLRIGTIHRRIGSLYQYSLRNKGPSDGTKKLKSLSDLHYNKAYTYLDAEEQSIFEYLTTLNEHVALNTQVEARSTSAYTTVKRLKCALTLLLRKKNITVLQAGGRSLQRTASKEGVTETLQGNGNERKSSKQKGRIEALNCSVEIVVDGLSVLDMMFKKVLKDLVQTFSKNPKITVVEKLDLTESKRMYEIYLRRAAERTTGINKLKEGIFLFNMIADVIEKIRAESSLDND